VTLSLLAHAYLTVVRLRAHDDAAQEPETRRGIVVRLELIPPTFAEVRRLILAIAGPEEERGFRLGWSLWRRAHQAVAKRCHSAKRDLLRARPDRGTVQPEPPTTVMLSLRFRLRASPRLSGLV
jgi:hypothetical protein